MRIYAVADIHGRPERLALLERGVTRTTPDVLVAAGDMDGRDPAEVLGRLHTLGLPVLFVRGNMDGEAINGLVAAYPNIRRLDLRPERIGGVPFVGIGGTIPAPLPSRLRLRGKTATADVERVLSFDTVLVVHPPPYGILDEGWGGWHAGSRTLRELLLRRQPRLCICGHIHERPGAAFLGKTLVVNASMGLQGSGALIRLEDDGRTRVDFL